MRNVLRADALFHSILTRFFLIPARERLRDGISSAQMRVLWIAGEVRPATPARVAGVLGLSRPSVTELAARLEKSGHLRRVRSEDDRREVFLELRPKGRRMLAEYARRRLERMHKVVGALDARERARLVGALETVDTLLARWKEARP